MHYKNGREAKVGDAVVGTVFNNGGAMIAGTLVSVTPGPDACSAMVGFVTTVPVEEDSFKRGYVLLNGNPVYFSGTLVKVQGTEKHGSDGSVAVTLYTQDYTECKNLLHAEDAAILAEPIKGIAPGGCDDLEVEELAKLLHEAGREAVERNLIVRTDVPTKGFMEWDDITEDAREGRRVQARFLLARYRISGK